MIKDRIEAAFAAADEDSLPRDVVDEAVKAGMRDFLTSDIARQFMTEVALMHRLSEDGESPSTLATNITVTFTDGARYQIDISFSCKELPSNG